MCVNCFNKTRDVINHYIYEIKNALKTSLSCSNQWIETSVKIHLKINGYVAIALVILGLLLLYWMYTRRKHTSVQKNSEDNDSSTR